MTVTAQAVKRMELVTQQSFSTAERRARALKQGGKGQVPLGKPGGGKNAAHWSLEHVINYGLSFAADPITEAPEQVEILSNLQNLDPATGIAQNIAPSSREAFFEWSTAVTKPHEAMRTIPGSTLHDALAGLIDWLSRPEGKKLRALLNQGRGRLYLDIVNTDGFYPSAVIGFLERDNFSEYDQGAFIGRYGFERNELPNFKVVISSETNEVSFDPPLPPAAEKAAPGPIRKTIRIPYAVFDALADLWADSRSHLESLATTSPPADAERLSIENETAASPGRNAAANRDQPAKNELDGPEQAHPTGVREKTQSRRSSQAGPSRLRQRKELLHAHPPSASTG